MLESLFVLILTGAACALVGTFLILRRLSMMSDAISHTVLLGIVLAFFLTRDLDSPWLLVGAAILGVITVSLVELLGRTRLVREDDAIGVVFPLLFSIAVILISKYAANSPLGTDLVLMGEVIYAGLDTVNFMEHEIPVSAIRMGGVLVLVLSFITLFFKELKAATFDAEYAIMIGIPHTMLFYAFMSLTSLTTVAAFDAVGSILVISFFIAPPAIALLFTKNLRQTLLLSVFFSMINCSIGYYVAIFFNLSMAGSCAAVNMIVFLFAILCNPKGILSRSLERRRTQARIRREILMLHIGKHTALSGDSAETRIADLPTHLLWKARDVKKIAEELMDEGILLSREGYYILTEKGEEHCRDLRRIYDL